MSAAYYGYRQPPPEESIYNLIPKVEQAQVKQKRYVSKYPANTPPTASTFGRSTASQVLTTNLGGQYNMDVKHQRKGATFGPKDVHSPNPKAYLQKQGTTSLPEPKLFRYTASRKPGVIPVSELPPITKRKPTNFIQQNALSVIMAGAARQKEEEMDYTRKPDYGKVPEYLSTVKKEIQAEKEYIAAAMDQERAMFEEGQPKMRLLPEEERQDLLNKLKLKWEAVNKNYQGMTHIVSLDTIGKVRRKEEYESQLQQLEKSIEKLSKKFVFVQDGQQF